MANNTGRFYKEIEDYVNKNVASYLTPIRNIESIKCKHVVTTNRTYIELVYEDSNIRYFDASEMGISAIGIMIGHIVANNPIR